MKRIEIIFAILKIPTDFLSVFLSLCIAYFFRVNHDDFWGWFAFNPADNIPQSEHFYQFSLGAALLFVFIATWQKTYLIQNSRNHKKEIINAISTSSIWIMSLISYFFVRREFFFSRFVLIFAFVLVIFLTPLARLLITKLQNFLFRRGLGVRRVLILGLGKVTDELAEIFEKDKKFNLLGVLSQKNVRQKKSFPVLGTFEKLEKIIKRKKVEEIFQVQGADESFSIVEICKNLHVKYRFVPDALEIQRTNILVENFHGIPMVELLPTPLEGWNRVVKRIFDIAFSALALLFLSPLFLIVAILIKLDSPGPVFFSRLPNGRPALRIGQRGKPFRLYKFRTMRKDAHNHLKKLVKEKNLRKEGPLYKIKDDPRITKLGHFLRMSSIDELPNLFSVIKGEMSIVGPRPHTPDEVSRYGEKNKRVLEIKPGITGLAQVSGRHNLKFETENKLDLFYIENWSLWLDLKIIFKTLGVVISDVVHQKKN